MTVSPKVNKTDKTKKLPSLNVFIKPHQTLNFTKTPNYLAAICLKACFIIILLFFL